MARIRPFGAYPPGYSEAVRLVIRGSKIIDVPFENERKALSWRGQFYAFLGAVKIAAAAPEATESMKELAELAMQLMASIREVDIGKWVVRLEHRDRSWQADALRNALVRDAPPPAGPPVPSDLLSMVVQSEPAAQLPELPTPTEPSPVGESKKKSYY